MSDETEASPSETVDEPTDDGGREFTTELKLVCAGWTATAILSGIALVVFRDVLAGLFV